MNKLQTVIAALKTWQRKNAGHTSGHCLHAVRVSLPAGLTLPQGEVDGHDMWAIQCFDALVKHPDDYGWRQVHSPLADQPCLVFFGGCGKVGVDEQGNDELAGHIAVYDPKTKTHYSNENHAWSPWWADRLKGAFVPK